VIGEVMARAPAGEVDGLDALLAVDGAARLLAGRVIEAMG